MIWSYIYIEISSSICFFYLQRLFQPFFASGSCIPVQPTGEFCCWAGADAADAADAPMLNILADGHQSISRWVF